MQAASCAGPIDFFEEIKDLINERNMVDVALIEFHRAFEKLLEKELVSDN